MFVSGLKTLTGSYNCNNNNKNNNFHKGSQFNLQPKFGELIFCWSVLNTLTFLMNDYRLKSLYRATKTTSPTKTTAAAAAAATTAAAAAATTTTPVGSSIRKLTGNNNKSSITFDSNNNNKNPRTYNNSSKSNKVFLHYIPRDPRLRIFNRTATLNKHLAALHSQRTLSELNITEDLCNYGELIGGSDYYNYDNSKHYKSQQEFKFQVSLFKF
ncbi:integrator complex subunit 5-like protein [Drosophila grimshawi]|uniref:integrator complex subunit 5-like protein n=1 Tax=Drosophila grimshawi TaxID=7222 RepID=UPI001C9333BD|nr:integrator complex subunit 5-like protein [Drosophila grimshawi]